MGRGLVTRLTAAGHTVRVFDHKPDHAAEVAREASAGSAGSATARSLDETLNSKIVILALWYPATAEFAAENADALDGKIVVDISNPLDAASARSDATALDAFVASDHQESKAVILDLIAGTGLRGLDAGSLDNSRVLERLTAFGIELGQRYGLGFDFGFKYLPATELTTSR